MFQMLICLECTLFLKLFMKQEVPKSVGFICSGTNSPTHLLSKWLINEFSGSLTRLVVCSVKNFLLLKKLKMEYLSRVK